MTDMRKCLDNIRADAKLYKKEVQRQGLLISEEIVDELIEVYVESGEEKISVPVQTLNEAIGFKDIDKQRAVSIKRNMNKQYADKLDDDKYFHIGATEKGNRYIFFIGTKKEE